MAPDCLPLRGDLKILCDNNENMDSVSIKRALVLHLGPDLPTDEKMRGFGHKYSQENGEWKRHGSAKASIAQPRSRVWDSMEEALERTATVFSALGVKVEGVSMKGLVEVIWRENLVSIVRLALERAYIGWLGLKKLAEVKEWKLKWKLRKGDVGIVVAAIMRATVLFELRLKTILKAAKSLGYPLNGFNFLQAALSSCAYAETACSLELATPLAKEEPIFATKDPDESNRLRKLGKLMEGESLEVLTLKVWDNVLRARFSAYRQIDEGRCCAEVKDLRVPVGQILPMRAVAVLIANEVDESLLDDDTFNKAELECARRAGLMAETPKTMVKTHMKKTVSRTV